ncbi:hypothetical protein IWQ62_001568 [Dispira parvispora]|uniref:Xaa-Pro dipeptidyl-peptidase-like domain-containing protein n=1 Tax=Dispira parvispora TaxID=1520584 RepID=A0A9W8E8E4_9FUNG|nr:hypothetical protein IWQ62_001568 [Dispira parvispora]
MSSRPRIQYIQSEYDGTRLELRVTVPTHLTECVVILVHPYPTLGGNFDNNVIMALEHHFQQQWQAVTVALNLRGAGNSQGHTSWTARPEVSDVTSVVKWLQAMKSGESNEQHVSCDPQGTQWSKLTRLILCGYSYGALVSALVPPGSATSFQDVHYILVSYPFGVAWALTLGRQRTCYRALETLLQAITKGQTKVRGLLSVAGNHDQFTSYSTYQGHHANLQAQVANGSPDTLPGYTFRILDNVDHFWFGQESFLCKEIDHWRTLTFARSMSNQTN